MYYLYHFLFIHAIAYLINIYCLLFITSIFIDKLDRSNDKQALHYFVINKLIKL